jgi:hypothetical protein
MTLTEWILLGILVATAVNVAMNAMQRRTVNNLNKGVTESRAKYLEWEKETRIEELKTLAELAKGSELLAKVMGEVKEVYPEIGKEKRR